MIRFFATIQFFVFTLTLNAQIFQSMQPVEQRTLVSAFNAISNFYVDSTDNKKLVETAITSMLKELDPHSSFIPKEEVERVNEPLEGSFEGIGIQFQIIEDTLLVIQTIAGTPADKVGVLPGDKMIYINDELIAGVKIQNSDVMKKLRGPRGSEVTVKIQRNGNPELRIFKIVRDKIPIYSVDATYMIDKETGYIKINNFGSTTVAEFKKSFAELKKKGMKNLILSLQGNGGGYLNAAVELADEFLSRDKLVVYTQGVRQPKKISNATGVGNFETGKLIILVDEYSASASEIVSGAVQDWDRGVIIGRRTFGKGLVQGQLPLPDGSMLRLTTARYYTPSGRCIQKPYKNRADKYERDIQTRMKNGELFHADSIHFPDSLKYETLTLKRTVYGGGGIMPDVFVPADTTKYTEYHRNLVSRGVLNNVVARYVNNNRDMLKKEYSTFDKYNKKFVTNDELIAKLVAAGEKEKIARNEDQLKISEPLIKLQIKALIARDLWDMNSYYRIIDVENESLQRALEILNTTGAYEKILSPSASR